MDNEVVKTMMEKIDRIADYVFKKDNVPKEEAEILLTSEEAADLLKISTRTLQRMRKDKTIPYMMVRSKCRYRLTDLEECVRRKIVHCMHIPADTRSAFPVISVHSPVSIQCRWQS